MIHRLVTVPRYKHLVSPFGGRRYCCQYTAGASVYEKICTLCTVKCRCLSLRLLYNALSVVQIVKIVYLCNINSIRVQPCTYITATALMPRHVKRINI